VYRQRLTDLAARVDQVEADCGAIVPTLAAARQSLATAQEAMPVPSEAVDNLAWARMKGDGAPLGSGFFMAAAQRAVAGGVTDLGAGLSDEVRDWFANEEAKARQVHATVNGAYEDADANAPKPAVVERSRRDDRDEFAPTDSSAAGSVSGVRSFGGGTSGGGGMPSTAIVADLSAVDGAGGHPGPGDGSGQAPGWAGPDNRAGVSPSSAFTGSPDVPAGGGLAGLAPAGDPLSGRGPLGPGTSGASVAGGAHVGAGGALGPRLGQAVSPPVGALPVGGAGAAGRERSRSGERSAAGPGVKTPRLAVTGMAPMGGHGHTAAAEQAGRSTWLVEDEDVWGTLSDASPPVFGAE
jgi:hypothetical protein